MPPSDNASADPSASASAVEFDVFLSHNSQDKPLVRELADTLIAYGLRPWLDERELVPGRPWQEAVEKIIATTKTAAVLYGPNGPGPWEVREMRLALNQFVRRELPVITVFLPGAPEEPDCPPFLQDLTWVDLREGLTDEGIGKLVWGITGEKPEVLLPHKVAPAIAGPLAARLRTRYGELVGQAWDKRWSEHAEGTNDPPKHPPFISSQGVRLLMETEDPRACLRPEFFRAGRVARSGGEPTEQHPDAWVDVERSEFAHNALQPEDGEPCDLSRLVITTDAGVGKTTMMEWLEVELNRGSGEQLGLLLTFRDLQKVVGDGGGDGILAMLARKITKKLPDFPEKETCQVLQFLRDQGRLVLLLDGLDQASPQGRAMAVFGDLIEDAAVSL